MTRARSCAARGRATSWCSCRGSARSATPPRPCGDAAKLDRRGVEVVPLYSRLSAAEQHRVFAPHTGRRIVLATNVAETSLTVPGIRYVVDSGVARISRYSARTKVQRLPIEAISQASRPAAVRPLRPRRGRHRDPALLRGGLRVAAGVHRPRDPAHQPGLGHPPDDVAAARRHRALPLRRAAGQAHHHRRRPAAGGAGRASRRADRDGSPRSGSGWPGCRSTRGWAG